MIPLSTHRLCFRFFKKSDFSLVEKLNTDPKVTSYLGGNSDPDMLEVSFRRYLTYHRQYPGYGYWFTFLKEKGTFVGFFVTKMLPETGETEIGYRLLPEFWGKGLATEGALAMVDYARNHLKVSKVVGVAQPRNVASRKVLEKAGLEFKKFDRFYQTQCAYYSLNLDK